MHKRRQARIDALARMRAMAEQREELALEHAAVVVRKADLELRLTSSKLDAATEWKSSFARDANGWLGLYEQVLLAEGDLLVQTRSAGASVRKASSGHSAQGERLLQARRDLEVVQRRSDRYRYEMDQEFERKMADDVADIWLSRRLHADR
ncbi:MAG: hypothetical protein J0H05_03630 [Stenotrophomonas acidaminiphila]|uniref:hypothetical protein n=1 Tax=Stenotrophomonas acidaminiphila TaxID=128780 RepID=UPI000AED1DF9|nr:hypothetical protein [Stenotrophomonas acidaminiphila]MBN8800753.1 hypothetical protein [Stenotrophomonas acidaminiphila]MDF9442289.1 hypothetical protein [Stenotrophomonas acidaminiphila]